EAPAVRPLDGARSRAEPLPGAIVRALTEQVQIKFRKDRPELIRIDHLVAGAAFLDTESIGEVLRAALNCDRRLEEAVAVAALHRNGAVRDDQIHRACRP